MAEKEQRRDGLFTNEKDESRSRLQSSRKVVDKYVRLLTKVYLSQAFTFSRSQVP